MTPRKPHTNAYGPQAGRQARPSAQRAQKNASVRIARHDRAAAKRASVKAAKVQSIPTARDEAPSKLDEKAFTIPNSELVVTRRHLLYGAIGVGAVAAASTAAAALGVFGQQEDLDILSVPAASVTSSDALSEVELDSRFGLVGNFELPYGTLVWCNDDAVAACLIPGEAAKPLTQIQLLFLGNGVATTIVEQAVGQDEGFEIYDVRATSEGVIWTEADILEGSWRIYTAALSEGGALLEPALVDQGNSDWETPTLAMVGNYAFWQVMPNTAGNATSSGSALKKARAGSTDVEVPYVSNGRMATAPCPTRDGVVITPRTDTSTVHYQLTYLDARTNDVLDTLILPQSMKPLEASYGRTGFMFCFEGIYDYGDGIANLGTYVPMRAATGSGYSNVPWFRWSRTPLCAPCWCDDYLVVKSTQSVCGIGLESLSYAAIDVETGSDDYGDFLASTGQSSYLVTFANVDSHPINEEAEQYCRVRVYAAL